MHIKRPDDPTPEGRLRLAALAIVDGVRLPDALGVCQAIVRWLEERLDLPEAETGRLLVECELMRNLRGRTAQFNDCQCDSAEGWQALTKLFHDLRDIERRMALTLNCRDKAT